MPLIINEKVFVIAEVANAHEGKLVKAKQITNAATNAKVDAIKFQKFTADELLETSHENYELFKKLELSSKEWKELIRYSKNKGLKVLLDVFGLKSAQDALKLKVDGLKIHSTDLTNPLLLEFLGKQKTPIFLSTAGCLLNEIDESLSILQKNPKEIILLHGYQGYPTKLDDTNLLRIPELKKKYDFPVGLMDHISGDSSHALILPLMGIAMGAQIIEKHITLDRKAKGIDYYSSLEPHEFKKLMTLIRKSEKTMGISNFKLSKNELNYRLQHKKNPVSKKIIPKNSLVKKELFEYKRTKLKQESTPYFDFEGKITSKTILKGEILTNAKIKNGCNKIAAVIACRAESDRLYGKPIQNIGNITILEFLINQIKTSTLIDDIILTISKSPGNEIFVTFAKEHNLKYILGDDRDVLKRLIDGAKYVGANKIFRVTSENPFIYWEKIDNVINEHIKGKFDFSFVDKLPIGSSYEIINLEAFEKSHKLGSRKHRSELCSLYIYEHQNDFKINKFQVQKNLQKPNIRLTVDTPEDLVVTQLIYSEIGKAGKPIPLSQVISFIENNSKIASINSKIPLGVTRIWN